MYSAAAGLLVADSAVAVMGCLGLNGIIPYLCAPPV